jgi:uncharacterized protein involved in cysteine biosynthesis
MKLTERLPNWVNVLSLLLLVLITIMLVIIIFRI